MHLVVVSYPRGLEVLYSERNDLFGKNISNSNSLLCTYTPLILIPMASKMSQIPWGVPIEDGLPYLLNCE